MKNLIKLFALAVVVLGFSVSSYGQLDATATSSGTLIATLKILKVDDMQFGNFTVTTGGSITLNPGASPTYAGVAPFSQPGVVSTANFDVTGSPNIYYDVSFTNLPTEVKHTNGTTTMPIGSFTSNLTVGNATIGSGVLNAFGTQTVNVGATLTVDVTQLPGTYTSEAFTVTVSYQ